MKPALTLKNMSTMFDAIKKTKPSVLIECNLCKNMVCNCAVTKLGIICGECMLKEFKKGNLK